MSIISSISHYFCVFPFDLPYSQEHNIHYLSYDHFALFAYFAVKNNSGGKTLFSNILPPQRAQSSQRVSLICLVFNYNWVYRDDLYFISIFIIHYSHCSYLPCMIQFLYRYVIGCVDIVKEINKILDYVSVTQLK